MCDDCGMLVTHKDKAGNIVKFTCNSLPKKKRLKTCFYWFRVTVDHQELDTINGQPVKHRNCPWGKEK